MPYLLGTGVTSGSRLTQSAYLLTYLYVLYDHIGSYGIDCGDIVLMYGGTNGDSITLCGEINEAGTCASYTVSGIH